MTQFSTRYIYIYIFLTSGVKLHIYLLNMVIQFVVFLTLSTLICRGTDISKYFSESLGIRDNESRLYYKRTKAFVERVYFIGRGCRFSSCTNLKMENNQFCK